jgi:S1-C subfamily serine protease
MFPFYMLCKGRTGKRNHLKKLLAVLLAAMLLVGGYKQRSQANRFIPYEPQAKSATGAIFLNKDGKRQFFCSGTEIGHTPEGDGVFLTARHCLADPDTNEVRTGLSVSFSPNEGGPFYDAAPIVLSLTDDVALLLLRDGADIPAVRIKDEKGLATGDRIFNVSFPLGTGKQVFHGEYMSPRFLILPGQILEQYPQWAYSMPMNMTIAHGSSGSGVFSQKDHALIAVAVGTFEEGSYNIAIPASRVINMLNHIQDNTVDKFEKAFPIQEAPPDFF